MPPVRNICNIHHDEKRGLYHRTLDLGYRPNGKRWRVKVTAKTKQRLARKVKDKVAQLEDDTYLPGTVPTLNQWWKYWCDNIAFERIKPGPLRNYRGYGKNHIVAIGENRLDAITPDHIRHLHMTMRRKGISSRTIRAVHNTLSVCLKDAVYEGKIAHNPCDRTPPPKSTSKTREAFTRDELHAIIATSRGQSAMMQARWIMALTLGARQSECLGLEWDRVDLDMGTIDLSWQLQRIPWMHGDQCGCEKHIKPTACPYRKPAVPAGVPIRPCYEGLWLTSPKTDSSRRLLPMPTVLRDAFTALRAEVDDAGLVFHDDKGRPITAHKDDDAWHQLCEHAGVRPLVLHSARHTMVSLLLESGVDPEVIRQIAGHSTILSTRNYMHVSTGAARKALEELGA